MMTTNLPDRATMYQALVQKDSSFEGIFFAAIRTTGIFCRPTCTARKPKPENVEYFPDTKTAITHGYRACKVCHPMELPGTMPTWLRPLMDEVEGDATIRLRAQDLRTRGLDPARVRRWFQKMHGMTFNAFLRMRRINQAFGQIKQGDRVTEAAFGSGYESLSGFGEGFKKTTGFAPADSKNRRVVSITRIPTPLGPMMAGATEKGICLLEFTDRRMIETQLIRLRKRIKAETLPGDSPYFSPLKKQLMEYFSGKRKSFELPLETPGTEFQKRVWIALQSIPFGETRSYAEQAKVIGKPSAVRAVARANGDNRIAIIIPCHRVIGADGKLTGYGGGLWRKEKLLAIEKQ